jgi:hypothetical protein
MSLPDLAVMDKHDELRTLEPRTTIPNPFAAPPEFELRPRKDQCLPITFDNGKKFAEHVFAAKAL